jgi:hypothetical protein
VQGLALSRAEKVWLFLGRFGRWGQAAPEMFAHGISACMYKHCDVLFHGSGCTVLSHTHPAHSCVLPTADTFAAVALPVPFMGVQGVFPVTAALACLLLYRQDCSVPSVLCAF